MLKKKAVFPKNNPNDPKDYAKIFEQLKTDIRQTQLRAALSITQELILLYWRTGKVLSEKVNTEKWGAKILERLARDLKKEFPDVSGFSLRNLHYMRKFAKSYQDPNCAAAAAQIPWGHNMLLLDKLNDPASRLWYVQQTIDGGWSRSTLETWLKSKLHGRKGKALTNFKQTLPAPQSDLAEQVLNDPYHLDFMTLARAHKEKELEQGLMNHLQQFLVELGDGFAFMGRQFRIEVEREDYQIDLLFYHVRLRCYVVVELKATAFDPRDAGQMNFYLSAVDDLLKHADDQPTIGILLCKTKNKVKVEYALRNSRSPIGVASYETKILKSLPKKLKSSLPTVEEIEAELSTVKAIKIRTQDKPKSPHSLILETTKKN
jgi:predicted nuclease of restriction endonuclease-like (RecB) superfamily